MLPAVIGEHLHFLGSPSTFGADGQCGVLIFAAAEGAGDGVVPFGFGEQDFCWSGDELKRGFEFKRMVDLGNVAAARLLRGFKNDAPPTFDALCGGLSEMLFSAAREHRRHARGAEFGRLLDAPLQAVEFEDGEQQMDGKSGFGFEFFVQREDDFVVGDGENFRAMEESVGHDVENLSGLGAQDAGEMRGLIAAERCCVLVRCVGNPTATSHAV